MTKIILGPAANEIEVGYDKTRLTLRIIREKDIIPGVKMSTNEITLAMFCKQLGITQEDLKVAHVE